MRVVHADDPVYDRFQFLMNAPALLNPVATAVESRIFYGYDVSDDETSGIFSARLGLYSNVLASGQGMAYPAKDHADWLSEVGFRDVTTVRDLPSEHGLGMGTR
ncbi:hypothetical protein OG271_16985 [Micromonospora rifamycinica]|uniref:hypothetical protein n=1 Tax=Micromonospora rifamycinica TaxID=291594 RepID=UPI002E2CF929|nr:hypothetical protein [Micromonospora rifamycinica]